MPTRTISVLVSVLLVAACAASGSSAGFDDTMNGTSPANGTPPPPPEKTSQSHPIPPPPPPPSPDAGVPDSGESCTPTTPTSKCGLLPQCGCTAAETCDVADSSGNTACVTAGTAAMGKPCTTTAGCARGLSCVFGTCHAFCDDTSKACTTSGTGSCVNVQASGGTAIPRFDVCLVKCDLRDPNACGGTTAAGTGACFADAKGNTDCEKTSGTKTDGQTCTGNDCGPGLVCVSITSGATTTSQCKRWCQVGSADCGAGAACGGFQTKMIVDGKEYGACP